MATIRKGDVVVLKSGGPSMTVERINDDCAFCIWFKGVNKQEGSFNLDTLEFYTSPSPESPVSGDDQ